MTVEIKFKSSVYRDLKNIKKPHSTRVMDKLKENDIDDVLVSVGGIIPDEDKPFLEEHGLKGFYGPGTELKTIVEFVKNNLKR